MAELSVVIIATDSEQRAVLQVLVDGTSVARTVHSASNYPAMASDPLIPRIQGLQPDCILVDVPADASNPALEAIELLHQELPTVAAFAIGNMSQAQLLVAAMRAEARAVIER